MSERSGASYRQIAADLRASITSGHLRPGQVLPSRRQLMAQYDTTYVTTGRALDELKAEGLIAARKGESFQVLAGQSVVWTPTASLGEVTDMWIGYSPATPDLAGIFGTKPNAQLLTRSWVGWLGGRPVEVAKSYVPAEISKGTPIEHTDIGPDGVQGQLREIGFLNQHAYLRAVARRSTERDVGLGLAQGAVILEITQRTTASGRCVEVRESLLDATVFTLEWEARR